MVVFGDEAIRRCHTFSSRSSCFIISLMSSLIFCCNTLFHLVSYSELFHIGNSFLVLTNVCVVDAGSDMFRGTPRDGDYIKEGFF